MSNKPRKPLLTDEDQLRINRSIDRKTDPTFIKIVSLAKENPSEFARLKQMYENKAGGNEMSTPCNEKGCKKLQVIGGFCTKHARRDPDLSKRIDDRQAAKRTPFSVVAHIKKAAPVQVKEVIEGDADPIIVQALDAAFNVIRKQYLDVLTGLTPVDSIMEAAKMLSSIKALEY